MYTYEAAVIYFEEEVLHNAAFISADVAKRKRALKNAENELYSFYPKYSPDKRPLPEKAIYEQSIWILRKDDSVLKGEQGITSLNLSGAIQVSMSGGNIQISPNVTRMLGRRRGRYA